MKPARSKNQPKLEQLGQQVEQLIKLCHSLSEENKQITTERDALLKKTNMVQDRVRSMIDEIKNMERQI